MKAEFPHTVELIDRLTSEGTLPGASVLVQRSGTPLIEYAAGLAQLEPPVPASTEHIWAVASISKPVAAAALMQLVDKGLLALDQPVAEILPDFAPDKGRVLVRHLLTHSSGVPDTFPDIPRIMEVGWARAVGEMPLLFEPGTACQYSTQTFELVSQMVSRLSGMDWVSYTAERIFAPLGMSSSSYSPPQEWNERIAVVYQRDGSTQNWCNDPMVRQFGAAGAGLFSTLRDLAAFGQAFLDGGIGILLAESHRQMTFLQTPGLKNLEGAPQTWGLGWYLNLDDRPSGIGGILSPRAYQHGGATTTWLAVDPDYDLVLVMLANRLDIEPTETWAIQAALAAAVLRDMESG